MLYDEVHINNLIHKNKTNTKDYFYMKYLKLFRL
jgi:hypothetical protein